MRGAYMMMEANKDAGNSMAQQLIRTSQHRRYLAIAQISLLGSLGLLSACQSNTCEIAADAQADAASAITTCSSEAFPCTNPVDFGNGNLHCDERYVKRTHASQCNDRRAEYQASKGCEALACNGKNEYCIYVPPISVSPESPSGNLCVTGCLSDSDCGEGALCECRDPMGICVEAHCKDADDCGPESSCIGSWGAASKPIYTCLSKSASCLSDKDCEYGQGCHYQADGSASCGPSAYYSVGRPFLIEGTARLAEASHSSNNDWSRSSSAKLDNLKSTAAKLSAHERLSLAQHWTKLALMEHASIAAFARFSLELMALGAPSELLQQTIAAMEDERIHTELCFAVARQFGADKLAASPLDVSGALDELNWQSILKNVILEGCIGETTAALEAKLLSERASEPSLAATLHQIAADEQRHAQLAWSFTKWCIEQHGEAAISICRSAIAEELRNGLSSSSQTSDHQLNITEQFGYMSRTERNELKRAVLSSVVLPCLDQLILAQA